jgi:hypothetical protein
MTRLYCCVVWIELPLQEPPLERFGTLSDGGPHEAMFSVITAV